MEDEIRKAMLRGMRDGFLLTLPLIILMIVFSYWIVNALQ